MQNFRGSKRSADEPGPKALSFNGMLQSTPIRSRALPAIIAQRCMPTPDDRMRTGVLSSLRLTASPDRTPGVASTPLQHTFSTALTPMGPRNQVTF